MRRSHLLPAPARHPRPRPLLLLTLCAALVLPTGCGGGESRAAGRSGAAPAATSPAAPFAPAAVAVVPAPGADGVKPDTQVAVTVRNGTLSSVQVRDQTGQVLPGDTSVDSTRWTASARLRPSGRYEVRVLAVDAKGGTTETTGAFRTLDPPRSRQLKAASVSPLDGSVVGVAQPLVVGFNHPVRDRAAVQKALTVTTVPAVQGAWYWIDDDHVHYRPRQFWPAGTKVTLDAKLAGIDAGGGYWGAADRTVSYAVGRQQVITIDVARLRLTVTRGGRALRSFRVTSGKPGWETRGGIKVVMEKITDKTWTNEEIDAPEDYTLHSDHALRMTNSGEFIHDAPWSLGNLGRRSASHGCVGMRPSDARWLYANTIVGDAIVVTGSPRRYGPLWNRYGDWNLDWPTWSAGNTRAA